MYLGKLMELSPSEDLYTKPIHPYTFALLSAIPIPDPEENAAASGSSWAASRPTRSTHPAAASSIPLAPRCRRPPAGPSPAGACYPNGHLAACHHPMNVSAGGDQGRREGPGEPAVGRRRTPSPQRRVAQPQAAELTAAAVALPASSHNPQKAYTPLTNWQFFQKAGIPPVDVSGSPHLHWFGLRVCAGSCAHRTGGSPG